jgi:endogenous inhibitor of DNA gyrase (YacG/DUF329 family)
MISVRCPICGQPMRGAGTTEWPQFPFCSSRCRLIDLGRWLGEDYRVAPEAGEGAPGTDSDVDETP